MTMESQIFYLFFRKLLLIAITSFVFFDNIQKHNKSQNKEKFFYK